MAILIWGLCWAAHFFLGLKERPTRRALLSSGTAYILTVALFEWFAMDSLPDEADALGFILATPLAGLPGAAIAFRYLYTNYARLWVDDVSELPDGVQLANDDWRVGVFFVLAAVATAIAVGVVRKLPVILALQN